MNEILASEICTVARQTVVLDTSIRCQNASFNQPAADQTFITRRYLHLYDAVPRISLHRPQIYQYDLAGRTATHVNHGDKPDATNFD